jgi:hypothetical protein
MDRPRALTRRRRCRKENPVSVRHYPARPIDRHPFDETNYVLEGVLHVESDGRVVVAAAGDLTLPCCPSMVAEFRDDQRQVLLVVQESC